MIEPKIIFQNEHFIVVDKPSGMLSVPGRDPMMRDAISWARKVYGEAYETHRLDMATSGLLIIALNKMTERYFKMQFQSRQVHKNYRAIVYGVPNPAVDEINLPLFPDWPNRPKQKVCFEHGKPSLTRYTTLQSSEHAALLELIPVTGRSHQLRVHLLAIGHPIVGDQLYGTARPNWAPRLLLQAYALEFIPPNSKESIRLEIPFDFELSHDGLPSLLVENNHAI
ncbi:MAG: RNA pseudouridine synthase [Gammaproteobacteria bacterium]|nr:RNA pseudouridine synthase [Gammaproteobacteria bacterium]